MKVKQPVGKAKLAGFSEPRFVTKSSPFEDPLFTQFNLPDKYLFLIKLSFRRLLQQIFQPCILIVL